VTKPKLEGENMQVRNITITKRVIDDQYSLVNAFTLSGSKIFDIIDVWVFKDKDTGCPKGLRVGASFKKDCNSHNDVLNHIFSEFKNSFFLNQINTTYLPYNSESKSIAKKFVDCLCTAEGLDQGSLDFFIDSFAQKNEKVTSPISLFSKNIEAREIKSEDDIRRVNMSHILISYKDNKSFSIYSTSLGRNCKTLTYKSWIGFDQDGEEKYYTNSPGVSHILIKDCSLDDFLKAITYESIKFRVVEASELTKIQRMFGSSTLKLDVKSVLAKDTFELHPKQKLESSLKI
jgi:hypothetical protein